MCENSIIKIIVSWKRIMKGVAWNECTYLFWEVSFCWIRWHLGQSDEVRIHSLLKMVISENFQNPRKFHLFFLII